MGNVSLQGVIMNDVDVLLKMVLHKEKGARTVNVNGEDFVLTYAAGLSFQEDCELAVVTQSRSMNDWKKLKKLLYCCLAEMTARGKGVLVAPVVTNNSTLIWRWAGGSEYIQLGRREKTTMEWWAARFQGLVRERKPDRPKQMGLL